MAADLKLFMILIGYRSRGFNTEQHDVIFLAGTSIENTAFLQQIRASVPLPKYIMVHIDAYVEVTQADGYAVSVVTDRQQLSPQDKKLFFVNLGGYKKGIFQEYHKSILLALTDMSELKKRAMADSFTTDMDSDFPNDARPHVDDRMKLGVDIDDAMEVQDKLGNYYISLTPNPGGRDSILDPVIKGFLKLEF
jgi:hypothetical protein